MDPVPGLDLSVPPFDLLDDAGRARLLASVDMGFHAAGQVLIEAGQPSPHVFVVLKGQLHAYDRDDTHGDQRFADYGPGDVFGAWAVMAGRARHSYRTDSDCLSFLIPAEVFRKLLSDYPRFAAWFNEGLAVKGQLADQAKGSELAELMVTQVGDAQLAPAETIAASASIADATLRLRDSRVDCLLVEDPQHAQPGIVTRTDLLEALALQQLPLASPVGPLAKRPLVSVRSDDVLFQALVAMTERHIERVVVHDNGRMAGTLGMAEVLSHYASHSHLISLRLARADTLEDIADAAQGMPRLVRTLHAQGARIPYLMELVSALNSRVMGRIFELLLPAHARDQVCLLVMGSEGRREQLLKTDQDNALIVADGFDWPELVDAMDGFSAALERVGYPPCPGGVMVNRAHWRMTATGWQRRVMQWRREYAGQAALDLSIALDARPIAGNTALFTPVQDELMALGQDDQLMHHLAKATLHFDTPLTLLGQVKGEARGTDLKKGGIFPVVHGLRCLALREGLTVRNSFERCEALAAAGALPAALGRDLPQALSVFHRLRLDTQLATLQAGGTPDNFVGVEQVRRLGRDLPQALSVFHRLRLDTQLATLQAGGTPDNFVVVEQLRRLDRELLRDALRVVKDFRLHVRTTFHLSD